MAALTINREDQDRIKSLLTEAVTVLCRNGLSYNSHVAIDGLLGITVDDRDVFLVKLTETVTHSDSSPDFSQVSELLGAAQNNFGLSLNADGSSPLPMHRFGGKDLNDNHTSTPAAINIAPLEDGVLSSHHRGGKRGRGSVGHAGDQPAAKRTHMSDSTLTTPTSAASGGVGRIGEDAGGNLVIKSEPIDYDDENAAHTPYTGKTLGVISTVNTDTNYNDSADDSYQGDQPESQDGVLQALRAALIHKLANNGTPMTPKFNNNNNNNESPSPTPSNNNNNSTGKKRKLTPKPEGSQESEVTLKCLMCTYETNRRYNFIRHMRGHSKSYAIYACDLCGERFHSEDELGAHGLNAHKGHHLTCDQCGMTFMSERGKNIHAKTHKMMPIPEKKSVECETQCSQNDLEESMLNSSGSKIITSTGQSNDEAAAKYRTLREQLSSRSLVIRFPVLNGRVQTAVVDGAMQDDEEQSQDEDDQPADLSISKSCSTSTSPPPPLEPKEESVSPVAKTTATMSSTAATTKPAVATTTSSAFTAIKSPAATILKTAAATTTATKSPAATTTTRSVVATTTKSLAATTTKSPAATTTKSPAVTTTKTPTATKTVTGTDASPSTSKPTPQTTKVVSSAMNLSLPSSSIPCTVSSSRVLPTSALSAALAAAAKTKSILISPPSASVSPTPSTSSATDDSKPKSRKQHAAQIVRLVTVKKEPTDEA